MQKEMNKIFFKLIITVLASVVILFILLPIITISLTTSPFLFYKTIIDKEVLDSIILTLKASLFSTLAAFVFGIPLAYMLARFNFYGKKIVKSIIEIPIIIPHSAAGIALLTVFGRESMFGKLTGFSIVGTELAISIAMFFVSIPFFIKSVEQGFNTIDERYEKVAISLGATPLQAFFTVTLPLAKKAIINGATMMWARGISEFGAIIILVYHPMVTPILIFDRYESFGLKYAKPVALLLILVCLIIFTVMRIIIERDKNDKN